MQKIHIKFSLIIKFLFDKKKIGHFFNQNDKKIDLKFIFFIDYECIQIFL